MRSVMKISLRRILSELNKMQATETIVGNNDKLFNPPQDRNYNRNPVQCAAEKSGCG